VDFEWDIPKEARNLRERGIDFTESIELFEDPLATIRADPDHSRGKHRFLIIGRTRAGRMLLTVFTDRGAAIRIISSRRATRREVRDYEKRV
jgi:hypothetical protein